MPCETLLLALSLLLSFGNALGLPKATPCAVNEVDLWGWTPRITSAPDILGLLRRGVLQKRDLTQTCGYLGEQALTCSDYSGTPLYCAYQTPYMGCCGVDDNDLFTSCTMYSTCVNQQQSSSVCPVQDCPIGYGVWYVLFFLALVR